MISSYSASVSDLRSEWHSLATAALSGNSTWDRTLDSLLQSTLEVGLSNPGQNPWTYRGTLFFSMTVGTTVGYGYFAPLTHLGKVLMFPYILISLSCCAWSFDKMSGLLERGLQSFVAQASGPSRREDAELVEDGLQLSKETDGPRVICEGACAATELPVSRKDLAFRTLALAVALATVLNIGCSCVLFWDSILDEDGETPEGFWAHLLLCAYFGIISYSTIGFGDTQFDRSSLGEGRFLIALTLSLIFIMVLFATVLKRISDYLVQRSGGDPGTAFLDRFELDAKRRGARMSVAVTTPALGARSHRSS